jgi:hypothetical protein
MSYSPGAFRSRVIELKSARGWGVKVLLAAISVTFFVSEVRRILALSPGLLDYFYLLLLASLGIKVATWIFVSEKELGIVGTWLDPKDYQPPSETALILLIAGTLAALVLTSRYLILFGISYVLYAVGNLVGWWRLRTELRVAIRGSRKRLEEEVPAKAIIYGKALDLSEIYYLAFPHILRSTTILGCAAATLIVASYARVHHSRMADAVAYIICIFDILVVQEVTIMFARAAFYSGIRPVYAAEYEQTRAEKRAFKTVE